MFVPGDEPVIVETALGTFGLTICMDLLFPEYIRGLVINGADYILNTTDWLRYGPLDEWQWQYKQTPGAGMHSRPGKHGVSGHGLPVGKRR